MMIDKTIPLGIDNLHSAAEFYDLKKDIVKGYEMTLLENEKDWKAARGYGAREASTVLGINSYKPRRQLYLEKRGEARPEELNDNELIKVGKMSEPLIRAQWAIEHPDYDVYDGTWLVFRDAVEQWRTCSLDMICVHRKTGKTIIGEIKTGLAVKGRWGEYCPNGYFAQLCAQLSITRFDGALLVARTRGVNGGIEDHGWERTYYYEWENAVVQKNIKYIEGEFRKFHDMVESGTYKERLVF